MSTRRLKAFRITPEALIDILTGKARPYSLPEGIGIERYGYEVQTNSAILVLSHPEWEESPMHQPVPVQDLQLGKVHVGARFEYTRPFQGE